MTGYVRQLRAEETPEAEARIENIDSLINKIVQYEEDCEDTPSLDELLEEIALVADIDSVSEDTDQVLLMTLHSSKGLEFPYVYMCGMEEEVFPSAMAMFSADSSDMEEERRLCYVGITRAMKKLTLSGAMRRMKNGEVSFHAPSRFIREIPRYLIQQSTYREPFSQTGAQTVRPGSSPSTEKAAVYSAKKATVYSRDRKNPFKDNPYIQKGMSLPGEESAPDYVAGNTVSHAKFGIGTVLAVEKTEKGYEVVVDFEGFGRRKLRSSVAKIKKI
jgi:DNA helicase-2/ATP-dependent DNA helicase PcrA